MSTPAFRPEDFVPEFAALAEVGGHWAVIGGIAVIIWTDFFLSAADLDRLELPQALASKDLDVKGTEAHADAVLRMWGSSARKQPYRFKATGRRIWALESMPRGEPGRKVVELTQDVPGAGSLQFALRMTVGDVAIRVLDPISCLQAKTDVLERELAANARGERKDQMHVRLLREIVPRYLAKLEAQGSKRFPTELQRAQGALANAARVQVLVPTASTPNRPPKSITIGSSSSRPRRQKP